MTPEGQIKKVIDRLLLDSRCYAAKQIGSPFGRPALDYHICHHGFYGAIEAKRDPSKHPTRRQSEVMCQVINAGGSVFLIDLPAGRDIHELRGWLVLPTPTFISTSARLWLTSQEIL